MPLDLDAAFNRKRAGQKAYLDGHAAEDIVSRDYQSRGYVLVETRWRGRSGEIDLIFRRASDYIFVEVKKARSLDIAATRLSERQLWRIARSAEDYLSNVIGQPFAVMRLDLAMVDGMGQVDVLENLSLF